MSPLLDEVMNKCNEDFIKRENIDFSRIDSTIYDMMDINEIIQKYEVQGSRINKLVSLEQILGIDNKSTITNLPERFPEVLDFYFDGSGDGYHSRSVGMLEYNEDNVIDGLRSSFKYEPIVLIESDIDKYTVLTNGRHRFMVMRILYLSAKSKCQNEEELNELIKKYTIPTEVVQIDYIKTYCKYLIDLFQPVSCMGECYDNLEKVNIGNNKEIYKLTKFISWNKKEEIFLSEEELELYNKSYTELRAEYKDYEITGKSKLKRFDGESQVLTDEELILFTRRIIEKTPKNKEELLEVLRVQSSKYESLNRFINLYFADLINYEKGEDKKDGNITRK